MPPVSDKRTRLPKLRTTEHKPAPRPEPLGEHAFARLDDEVVARLRALQPRMSKPWRRATGSDVLRAVIFVGLPVIEAAYPPTADEAPTADDAPPARRSK
jgi:hypothetical protein